MLQIWKPHFFILTPSALYYTEETEVDDEEKGLESDRRTLMQVRLSGAEHLCSPSSEQTNLANLLLLC